MKKLYVVEQDGFNGKWLICKVWTNKRQAIKSCLAHKREWPRENFRVARYVRQDIVRED